MNYRQPFVGSWPITQRYGEIVPGVTYAGKPHTGIDYGCPEGTEILASNDGIVVFAGIDQTGYGFMIIIQHNDGKSTLYAHLSQVKVVLRQKLSQSDVIGLSGNTGNSTGPHLHFEARKVWNDPRTHFNPMDLPLMSVDDSVITGATHLKDASSLGKYVEVICPDGARAFHPDWSPRFTGFPKGTKLYYTGQTVTRPGYPYTYAAVYEDPQIYYVAVNDGQTQILDSCDPPKSAAP